MAAIKPLYVDAATGLATEADPTRQTIQVPAPVAAADAANKAYVDAHAGTGAGAGTAAPTGFLGCGMAQVDVGPVPVDSANLTITDARVHPASVVLAQVSGVPPEDKDPDEIPMDLYQLFTTAGDGEIRCVLRGLQGYIADKFIVVYFLGST